MSYQDSNGVAEHRAARADVCAQHCDDYKGNRTHLQRVADLEYQRGNKYDGGNLIHGAGHKCPKEDDNDNKHRPCHAVNHNDALDNPGEKSKVLEHANDDHHTNQKQDYIQLTFANKNR